MNDKHVFGKPSLRNPEWQLDEFERINDQIGQSLFVKDLQHHVIRREGDTPAICEYAYLALSFTK